MSIIQPPKPKAPTVDNVVASIKSSNQALYNTILNAVASGFKSVWDNKKFTAQEIFDGFGTDAKDLFILSASLQDLIKHVNPDYQPIAPPKDFTINEDGTVTVIEPEK
jgi:hypothetical protein